MPHFDALKIYIAVENIVRKGESACKKQFLLFSQCFLPYMVLILHFKCSNLDLSKILLSGSGLNLSCGIAFSLVQSKFYNFIKSDCISTNH